jgi:hypothetical protein
VLNVEIRYEWARLTSECRHEARKMVKIADANTVVLIAVCEAVSYRPFSDALSSRMVDGKRLPVSYTESAFTEHTPVWLSQRRGKLAVQLL